MRLRTKVLSGVVAACVAVSIYDPFIPQLVYYFVMIELFCPEFNVLSTDCGHYTPEFILSRVYFFLFVFAAFVMGRRAIRAYIKEMDEWERREREKNEGWKDD